MDQFRFSAWLGLGLAGLAATAAFPARADEPAGPPSPASVDAAAPSDGGGDFFTRWQARARAAQAAQPHWMTPLVTVTPRLEQEFRYDQINEQLGNGQHLDNYGGGKGLELIPTSTNEVILNLPPFLDRTYSRVQSQIGSGFSDTPILLVKQRLLSAPESSGNYILTAFLGLSAPTAATRFTPHDDAWAVTPTIAAGKGWGDFDIQSTLGIQLPVDYVAQNAQAVLSNTTFQYHFAKYFWPEVEVNETYWTGAARGGKFQTFFTPGVILGRFVLHDNVKANFGVGYQFAATPNTMYNPITPLYDRALLMTARLTF